MRFVLLIIIMLSSPFVFGQKINIVKYSSQADFKVYVTSIEQEADLKVCRVHYPILAEGNNGKWFFGNSAQADKNIMFVDYPSQSDLKIYYVKYAIHAGWVNSDKKRLLEK